MLKGGRFFGVAGKTEMLGGQHKAFVRRQLPRYGCVSVAEGLGIAVAVRSRAKALYV